MIVFRFEDRNMVILPDWVERVLHILTVNDFPTSTATTYRWR